MASPAAILGIMVEASTKTASANLMKLEGQMRGVAATSEASAAKTAASWESAGRKMQSVGGSMTKYITLPAVALGAAAIKTSIDFNKAMTLIQTQAGASAKEVEKLRQKILDFAGSGKTAFGPTELAQGLYAIESAGIHGAKALDTLKASSKLAMIGQVGLADTTKAVTAATKTGIKGTGDLTKTIGTLNATVGSGQMHMEDLLSAMGSGFLGTASQLGLSLSDVNAALAELTKQGVPAASAATRLKMTFTSMATIATRSGAADAIKSIGLNADQLSNSLRTQGLIPTLELLQKHMQGLSDAAKTNLLATAFGGSRSGGTIMQLLGNLDDLNTTLGSIHKHSDEVNKSFAAAKKTSAEELQIEWAKLQAVLVKLGDKLIPVVIPALQTAGDVVVRIVDAFTKMPKFAQDFLIGAVVLGPFISGLGKILTLYGSIRTAAAGAATAEEGMGGLGGGAGAAGGAAGLLFGTALVAAAAQYIDRHGHALDILPSEKSQHQAKVFQSTADTLNQSLDSIKKHADDLYNAAPKDIKAVGDALGKAKGAGLDTQSSFGDITQQLRKDYGTLGVAASLMSQKQKDAAIAAARQAVQSGDMTRADLHHLMRVFDDASGSAGDFKTSMSDAWNAIADKTGQTVEKVKQGTGSMAKKWIADLKNIQGVNANVLTAIASDTNKQLKQYGVAEIHFSASSAAHGPMGGTRRATGGVIPGQGNSDSVHAMLTPGEFVVRKAVAEKTRPFLEALNAQHYAQGGSVNFGGHPSNVSPAVANFIATMQSHFPLAVTATTDGSHVSGSYHYKGEAVDLSAASPVMFAASEWIKRSGTYRSLQEGIHNPNLSVAGGKMVSPSYYSSVWADHADHIHAALTGKFGALAQQIARQVISGPAGAYKNLLQANADKTRGAANAYIKRHAASGAFDVGSGGGALSKPQLMSLWNSTGKGGDANLMAAIALAESGGNPGVTNSIGARGLWQIIPSTAANFGLNYGNLTNPRANALGAHAILAGQGLGAWDTYSSGAYAQYLRKGGRVQGAVNTPQAVVGHGGESMLPVGAKIEIHFEGSAGPLMAEMVETAHVVVDGRKAEIAEFTLRAGGQNVRRARQLTGA